MPHNKTFQRALYCLAHPFSIIAALLLLLNALVLQPTFPSWWTGKIGDVAWLFFAPFVVALLLAWLIPTGYGHHDEIVAVGALSIAGLSFASVKTIPQVNALVVQGYQSLTGYPPKLMLDPTDLITLPSLVAVLWLWNRAEGQSLPSVRPWLALGLAVLAIVADSPAPQKTGIVCLTQSGSRVWAFRELIQGEGNIFQTHSWEGFSTEDGGLHWSTGGTRSSNPCTGTSAQNSIVDQRTGNSIVASGGNTVDVMIHLGESKTVTVFQPN